jgi:hypothetical protein
MKANSQYNFGGAPAAGLINTGFRAGDLSEVIDASRINGFARHEPFMKAVETVHDALGV